MRAEQWIPEILILIRYLIDTRIRCIVSGFRFPVHSFQFSVTNQPTRLSLKMQTNNNTLLALAPADPTMASTGAEADKRDRVSAATAAMPSIAQENAEHARGHACSPIGEASRIFNMWSPASYATSDPLGRSHGLTPRSPVRERG